MTNNYSPYFYIYLAWHPESSEGQKFAKYIFKYICGDPESALVNDIYIPIFFRSQPFDTTTNQPKAIDFSKTLNSATFVLVDNNMVNDDSWESYVGKLWTDSQSQNPNHRVYPVALTKASYNLNDNIERTNFIRIYEETDWQSKQEKLLRQVLHACSRQLKQVQSPEQLNHENSPPPIKLFLSHAKQDGLPLVTKIKSWLQADESLNTFFDAKDIAPGYDFAKEIDAGLKDSALLICQTDAYATRYWCRQEVLKGKQYRIPALLINDLNVGEDRSFPYIGNIPTLRWQGEKSIPTIVNKILFGVLQYYYFPAHVENLKKIGKVNQDAIVVPFAPELLTQLQQSLNINKSQDNQLIVYPDPPLGEDEVEILKNFNPQLKISTPSQPMSIANNPQNKPLSGKIIGISISESPDLERQGFSDFHLKRALMEISRHLLAKGATIAYGGDLRNDGFTFNLVEMVKVYNNQSTERGEKILNYLAWPLYLTAETSDIKAENKKELSIKEIPIPQFIQQSFDIDKETFLKPDSAENSYIWANCLTAMRETMVEEIDARIILGGKVTGYKGAYPGIAEEAALMIHRNKPLFVLGAFGGCAKAVGEGIMGNNPESLTQEYQVNQNPDYADMLNFYNHKATSDSNHKEIDYSSFVATFQDSGFDGLNNGLTEEENQLLFTTEDLDEMVYFILQGLQNILNNKKN